MTKAWSLVEIMHRYHPLRISQYTVGLSGLPFTQPVSQPTLHSTNTWVTSDTSIGLVDGPRAAAPPPGMGPSATFPPSIAICKTVE